MCKVLCGHRLLFSWGTYLGVKLLTNTVILDLPRRFGGKESTWQCRRRKRCEFNPWVEKIPWSRKWQPPLVFLPGKLHEQRRLVGCSPWGSKSWTRLSIDTHKHTHKHTITARLTVWGPSKLLSKVAAPFYISTSMKRSTCSPRLVFLITAILVGMK